MEKAEVMAPRRYAEGIASTLSSTQTSTVLISRASLGTVDKRSAETWSEQKFLEVHMALVPVAFPF